MSMTIWRASSPSLRASCATASRSSLGLSSPPIASIC
jgi:hypothetical protein